jgi:uncharacterized cupin superfamily protein
MDPSDHHHHDHHIRSTPVTPNPTQQESPGFNLIDTYVVINGPCASAVAGGHQFWERLSTGQDNTLTDTSWLVGTYTYDTNWPNWEMHPDGDEIVTTTSGHIDLIVELNGQQTVWPAPAGTTVVIPAGVWHTANVSTPASALHITHGANTQGRIRDPQPAA